MGNAEFDTRRRRASTRRHAPHDAAAEHDAADQGRIALGFAETLCTWRSFQRSPQWAEIVMGRVRFPVPPLGCRGLLTAEKSKV